jgi:cathepsin X
MRGIFMVLMVLVVSVTLAWACRCLKEPETPVDPVIRSPLPHQYLNASDLPEAWDWRNINGVNYCSKVMTQQNPAVCGSCWAEAATGAISDRYAIATQNKLRVQLAPQSLLNFNERTSGGSCNGGSDYVAYRFMHKYGLVDDTCAPFQGLNWLHGFEVAAMTEVEDVRNHQCYICTWSGICTYVSSDKARLYGVDEYGTAKGVAEMKAEIYARGPISCSLNSEAPEFDKYRGGIISCADSKHPDCHSKETDHVIVIAGWGVDKKTGTEYWVGRNSYGSQWGEGAGGGWFRIRLGVDELGLESNACRWAVPAAKDVERALQQYQDAL